MIVNPSATQGLAGLFHALLRVMTALTFMSHGTMKLLGFPQMPGVTGQPLMPSPPLLSLFGVAGMMEIIGGLLLLAGLFTRPVAFLLAGQMAVAYWMFHANGGIVPAVNSGESAYLFCFIFLWLSAAGAGPFSIDNRSNEEEEFGRIG